MKRHAIQEGLQRLIAEHDDPLHREVGRVQLQDISLADDIFVFFLEFVRDPHDVVGIGLIGRIVGCEQHRGRNDAGRGGRYEIFGEFAPRAL